MNLRDKRKFLVPMQLKGRKVTDIVLELKTLQESLSATEQGEFEELREQLAPVAARLAENDLLRNSDKTVKLLVACCIANVLRLSAPAAPYTSEQLKVNHTAG